MPLVFTALRPKKLVNRALNDAEKVEAAYAAKTTRAVLDLLNGLRGDATARSIAAGILLPVYQDSGL